MYPFLHDWPQKGQVGSWVPGWGRFNLSKLPLSWGTRLGISNPSSTVGLLRAGLDTRCQVRETLPPLPCLASPSMARPCCSRPGKLYLLFHSWPQLRVCQSYGCQAGEFVPPFPRMAYPVLARRHWDAWP